MSERNPTASWSAFIAGITTFCNSGSPISALNCLQVSARLACTFAYEPDSFAACPVAPDCFIMASAYSSLVACFVASSRSDQSLADSTSPFCMAYWAIWVSFAKRPIASPPSYDPLMNELSADIESSSDLSQKADASDARYNPLWARSVDSSISFPRPLNFAVRLVMYGVSLVDTTPVELATSSSFD